MIASIYLEQFAGRADVEHEYQCTVPADAELLVAWYGNGCYSGDSFVLFRRGGKLYEVNGGHCSCYGLEGQWEPEETSVRALRFVLEKGTKFTGDYDGAAAAAAALRQVLDALDAEGWA